MEHPVSLPEQVALRAGTDPSAIAVREVDGADYTSAAFWQLCQDWAGCLRAHGVGNGDTVLVMQPTSVQALAIWIGAALLGAVEVPLNTQLRGSLLAHVVRDSRARIAVVSDRYLDEFAALGPDLDGLEQTLVTGPVSTAFEQAASAAGVAVQAVDEPPRASPENWEFPHEWDLACLLYTSGTTGPSKGVMVSWGQLFETTVGTGPEHTLRQPSTVFYSPYPTFHISGKTPLYATMLGGGAVVLRERFDTARFWPDIRTYGCTFTLLLATTANFILGRPAQDDDHDNPLVGVLFSPWIPGVEEFKKRFGVEAYSVYNMTEISCPIVGGWDDEPIDPAVCGTARPGFDLRVVDEHDREVPPGVPGELVIRTARPWRLMSGYWGLEGATVEAWRNQWFHTGDQFSVDAQGRYRYLDRMKDSIRRRGENISSAELESEALQHPEVETAAAVAVPDPISEQEIKLLVRRTVGSELTEQDLHGFLADRLPRFMVPRYIEIVTDFPYTATGKIRKTELRDAGLTPSTWDSRPAGSQR